MSSFRLILVSVGALAALAFGAVFVSPAPHKVIAEVLIKDVHLVADVVSSSRERAIGLAGRDSIPKNNGMLFRLETSESGRIWMKGMKIPIDIVWIKNNKIADIEENVRPQHPGTPDVSLRIYEPDVPVEYVFETNAGFVRKHDIRIGDPVRVVWRDSTPRFENGEAGMASEQKQAFPGSEFFIELERFGRARGYNFRVGDLLQENAAYKKFQISYVAGALTLNGVMNVPTEIPPAGGFPVLILNHGLISPEVYFSGRGSKREQDFFARRDYITIHPDYRGHASSSPNPRPHHDFYAGYTQDVVALIDALKSAPYGLIDKNRIGMWGHSMGGGIAARIAVLDPRIRAYVLFAPLSANVEDNFYELTDTEIQWLHTTYGPPGDRVYQKISPRAYFSDITAPFQIHHGTADHDVPIRFSEDIFRALERLGKKAEFYSYADETHEFGAAWSTAAERALQFFDRYVKDAQ